MIYDILIQLLRKYFYIVSFEKFKCTTSNRVLERYIAKHPLLTPEFIMVDNQPHGFKHLNRKLKSLEQFPIYCELEYLEESEEDEEVKFIESIDLFSEVTLSLQSQVSTLNHLCNLFESSIYIDRIKRIGNLGESSLLIYSRIGDIFLESFFEDELDENYISEAEIENSFLKQINSYINFIKVFDEIFFKKKKLNAIDKTLMP